MLCLNGRDTPYPWKRHAVSIKVLSESDITDRNILVDQTITWQRTEQPGGLPAYALLRDGIEFA